MARCLFNGYGLVICEWTRKLLWLTSSVGHCSAKRKCKEGECFMLLDDDVIGLSVFFVAGRPSLGLCSDRS